VSYGIGPQDEVTAEEYDIAMKRGSQRRRKRLSPQDAFTRHEDYLTVLHYRVQQLEASVEELREINQVLKEARSGR
jgi:hypothetical protein